MSEERQNRNSLTVHMIANAHLDPVWLWRWTEGFSAAVGTFRTVLDIMRETPGFTFTCAQAAVYEWIERYEPEMFEEIKQRVREGRWEVVGGWWVQCDCNIPSGESFVRQALCGQRYFREKLGVQASVGYSVDSFGHAATLPQLLAKAGLGAYVFFRPGPHEKALPEEMFWWEAPDGSRVLACRPPGHYLFAQDGPAQRIREHAAQAVRGISDVPSFYGVGDHGGGPTRGQVAAVRAAGADPTMPRVVFGRLDEFFRRARAQRKDFPVVREDLQHHARGCYTTHAAVKRWNREAEALLGTAEAFCTLASAVARADYPRDDLARAWRNVLFNQFHDILPGSSLPVCYADARDLYGESRSLANRALLGALHKLARRVDTSGEWQAVLVFNPLPWRARVPVEADNPFGLKLPSHVEDAHAHPVCSQAVRGCCLAGSRTVRHVWMAELPALGYRLYYIRAGQAGEVAPAGRLETARCALENERWRLEIDPAGGHIASLHDRVHGVEVFARPAAVPLVLRDEGDTWGHDVVAFRDVIGRFEDAEVTLEESGPVRAALRVRSRYGRSTLTQVFRLYRGSPRIEIDMEVDWHEQFRMLKLAFPLGVEDAVVTASAPYGHLVREANGEEEPCGPWVDVTGTAHGARGEVTYGLACITDSKHGYDCLGSELRVNVLRSPVYAWHHPALPEPGRVYEFMDQGRSLLRYLLVPHRGPWQRAGVVRESLAVNRPPIVTQESPHQGHAPREWTGAEAGPDNVILSALKRAEDGDGLVLRLWETAGRAGHGWVNLPELQARWRGRIGPNEVKTLRLRRVGAAWQWQETNLLEERES